MATLTEPSPAVLDSFPRWSTGRMYAIAFDLDTEELQRSYGALLGSRAAFSSAARPSRRLLALLAV